MGSPCEIKIKLEYQIIIGIKHIIPMREEVSASCSADTTALEVVGPNSRYVSVNNLYVFKRKIFVACSVGYFLGLLSAPTN